MTISGDVAQRYSDLSAAINDHATALEQLQEHMLAAENAIDMHSHRPIEEMQAAIAALRSEVATMREEERPGIAVNVPPMAINWGIIVALTLGPWIGALVQGLAPR